MWLDFCGEQKDEKSKLMKEYAKQNKDSDMSLASTKKKEDFGGMLPAFQFSRASCKAPALVISGEMIMPPTLLSIQ